MGVGKTRGKGMPDETKPKSVLDCRRVDDSLPVFKMLETEICPPDCEILLCTRRRYEDMLTGSGQSVCNYNEDPASFRILH